MSDDLTVFIVKCECGAISHHSYLTKTRYFKCVRCGKLLRNPQKQLMRASPAEIQALVPKIKQLIETGLSRFEIADKLNINNNTIYEITRRLQLKPGPILPEIFCGVCIVDFSQPLELRQELEWCWILECLNCGNKILVVKPTYSRENFIVHNCIEPKKKNEKTDPEPNSFERIDPEAL